MGNRDIGEHSRKTRNDNENDERPFKKAKYVWQLKGKYHLKENYKQTNSPDMKEGCSKERIEEQKQDENIVNINNNNTKNKSCNKCCLDTLLARSNALLESEDSSDLDFSSNNTDRSIYDEIPVTLVKPTQNLDDYLSKWQARQVAKCYVDNTINSILEQWKLAPVDAADFVETCDNDGHVEDEGILMAIQSHGLQSGLHNPSNTGHGQHGEASHDYRLPPGFFERSSLEESAIDNYENVCYENRRKAEQEMHCHSDIEKNDSYEMSDQTDFLSAAVSVAIQKKGLSSYSCG